MISQRKPCQNPRWSRELPAVYPPRGTLYSPWPVSRPTPPAARGDRRGSPPVEEEELEEVPEGWNPSDDEEEEYVPPSKRPRRKAQDASKHWRTGAITGAGTGTGSWRSLARELPLLRPVQPGKVQMQQTEVDVLSQVTITPEELIFQELSDGNKKTKG